MSYSIIKHGKNKKKQEFQRKITVENRGRTVKTAVGLPSLLAEDVYQAYDNKLFDKKTRYVAIERKKSIAKKLHEKLSKIFKNFDIVDKSVHKVDLGQYFEEKSLEYLALDICGNFSAQIANWLNKSQKYLADNARVSFTFCVNERQKNFHESIMKITKGNFYKRENDYFSNGLYTYGFYTEKQKKTIKSQIAMLKISMPNKDVEINYVSLYNNTEKGKKTGAYMVCIDTIVKNKKTKITAYQQNLVHRILEDYNSKVKNTSVVNSTKTKKSKKDTFAKKVEIYTQKDLEKLYNPKTQRKLKKLAKQYDTKVSRIIGGIKREITCQSL